MRVRDRPAQCGGKVDYCMRQISFVLRKLLLYIIIAKHQITLSCDTPRSPERFDNLLRSEFNSSGKWRNCGSCQPKYLYNKTCFGVELSHSYSSLFLAQQLFHVETYLTTKNMRDFHQTVIDDICQMIGWPSICLHDDLIIQLLMINFDMTMQQILKLCKV